jgi:hypothetical protein
MDAVRAPVAPVDAPGMPVGVSARWAFLWLIETFSAHRAVEVSAPLHGGSTEMRSDQGVRVGWMVTGGSEGTALTLSAGPFIVDVSFVQ